MQIFSDGEIDLDLTDMSICNHCRKLVPELETHRCFCGTRLCSDCVHRVEVRIGNGIFYQYRCRKHAPGKHAE